MDCSGSTMTELHREYKKRCLNVGNLVIQMPMRQSTRVMPLPVMLRSILIALLIYLRFTPTISYLRSSSQVDTRLSEVCTNLIRKYKDYSLVALCAELQKRYEMGKQKFALFRSPLPLRLDYIPSVPVLVRSLILAELNYIDVYSKKAENLSTHGKNVTSTSGKS